MTKSDKAKAIMELMRGSVENVTYNFIKDSSHLDATVSGSKRWEEGQKEEEWGGGFGQQNPYDIGKAASRQATSLKIMEDLKEVYKFAEETFLGMITD